MMIFVELKQMINSRFPIQKLQQNFIFLLAPAPQYQMQMHLNQWHLTATSTTRTNLHISRAGLPRVPGVPGRGGAGVGQQVGLQPVPARVQVPAAPSRVTCHVSRVAAIKVYSAMWNLICKVWWCGLSCPVPGLIFLKVPSCQNGCYHPWLMTRAFKGEREWENVAKMWIVSPLYNCILPGWRPPSLRSPGPGPGIIIKCSHTFT